MLRQNTCTQGAEKEYHPSEADQALHDDDPKGLWKARSKPKGPYTEIGKGFTPTLCLSPEQQEARSAAEEAWRKKQEAWNAEENTWSGIDGYMETYPRRFAERLTQEHWVRANSASQSKQITKVQS
jgi:hypothetical protein